MAGRKKFSTQETVQIILAVIAAISAIGVAYFQFGSKPSEPPAPTDGASAIQYSGRILDAATQKPIANAKITFDAPGPSPQVAYSDAEGVYIFNVAHSDNQLSGRIRVDVNGYEIYNRNISLSADILNLEDIRLSPILSIVTITAEPTNIIVPTETTSPTSTPSFSEAITVMNNFYSWINDAGNKDDLMRSWNLETSGINGFQCREAAGCDFKKFSDFWFDLKVQYKLYDCGSNLVDVEIRTYNRNPLLASTPTAPTYFRYQLVEVNSELKINKGIAIEGHGADCKLQVSVP